jgi:uncharacterized OB-fold protein
MSVPLLPDLDDPIEGPFWAAAREHRLVVQRCLTCGALRFPLLVGCPDCLGRTFEWAPMVGSGTVWSWAVYHRVLNAAFGGQTPYTIAVVDLDEGPRVTARMAASSPPVAVGDRVVADFEDLTEDVTILRWHLAPPDVDESDTTRGTTTE